MATTTQIATESKRPSLSQNIEALYAAMHVGGAYDAKRDVIKNGTRNGLNFSISNDPKDEKHTIKGFKTKMLEQQTELLMGKDSKVVTTAMRTSIYGDHSSRKYWSM